MNPSPHHDSYKSNVTKEVSGKDFGPGPISGLPWHSGCSLSTMPGFEEYRGRKCDGYTTWCPHDTWDDIASFKGGWTTLKDWPGRLSIALAPLPLTNPAAKDPTEWDRIAKGDHDPVYLEFSQKLANSGRKNVTVRIGWEHSHDGYPWYSGGNPVGYKKAFRHMVEILRRYNPSVIIDWTSLKRGHAPISAETTYPGDDVVDVVGVDYYDAWPALNDAHIWDKQYKELYHGGPWGLGTWLDFAKSHKKKLSLPEWGINVGKSPGAVDNPFYIQKMFEFLKANAEHIAYENYFGQKDRHRLFPADLNPKSSAMYKKLWSPQAPLIKPPRAGRG